MTQHWDPESYAEHARFVSDLGAPVVDLLAPRPGERVLDVGCGDGALTERFRDAGCTVVGVDSSPEQVWAALQRGLDARIVDARELPFDAEFDAVFSNAALHWIPDADAAIDGVWRALKPGGRFVAECGGAGCVASVRDSFAEALRARGVDSAAVDPWYFPTAEEYRARLERRGFRVDSIERFARPTPLPGDVVHWLEVFAQPFIAAVPEPARPALLADMRSRLAPRIQRPDGTWVVDYVRLRFAAFRPQESGP